MFQKVVYILIVFLFSLSFLIRNMYIKMLHVLSDCNRTQTHNHLAEWFSVHLWTKWLWVWVPLQSLKTSDFIPVSSKEFLDIQATIKWGFTLKRGRDMIRTYSLQWLSHKNMPFSQTEGYFKNLYCCFCEEFMFFLMALKLKLYN